MTFREPRWRWGRPVAFVALLLSGCVARQPPCGSKARDQYYESGRYLVELSEATERATYYLDDAARDHCPAALVLDIDETALSNWPEISSEGFCFDPTTWDQWVTAASAPAIQPTLELYRAALDRGISVFFLTGRPESQRVPTERNLRAAGFTTWTRLIMKPDSVHYASAACFKARERCTLLSEG